MLINCSECNHKVSDKANNCPNCGNLINRIPVKKEGCFLQTLNTGCLFFVVMLLIYFIGGVIYIFYKRYLN